MAVLEVRDGAVGVRGERGQGATGETDWRVQVRVDEPEVQRVADEALALHCHRKFCATSMRQALEAHRRAPQTG